MKTHAGCVTCCLPCITFGQIAEVADEGRSLGKNKACVGQGMVYGLLMMVQCQWVYSCMYREKVRAKYGLPAEPCCDCCVHFWCGSCALCQEHAELKARGNDPSQGWTTTRPPNTVSIFR
ncbi:cell number regulator 7-like [Neltuma alba]|uniref:cell number regulator 7-like n=1 Tax=Neltuma alba TaxID=207710 RepID=UPI0010A43A69|nr:cell number regulator 7-like [Prosopis alba]